MARSSSNYAIFHFFFENVIPLFINTEVYGFVEVSNLEFVVRFKLHVHFVGRTRTPQ